MKSKEGMSIRIKRSVYLGHTFSSFFYYSLFISFLFYSIWDDLWFTRLVFDIFSQSHFISFQFKKKSFNEIELNL